ncbi:MAG: ArnT family glycosyltransferase [Chloroflexota bacterium]
MSLSSYNPALDLLITALITLLAIGAGVTVLRWAGLAPPDRLERLVFGWPVGLALLSYGMLAFGLMGHLRLWAAWSMVALLTLLAAPVAMSAARAVPGLLPLKVERSTRTAGSALLIALIGGIFVLNAFGALSPPTYSDTINHYLARAFYYVQQGSIPFVPYKLWNQPSSQEMIYAALLLIFPGSGGAAVQLGLTLLGTLSLVAFGRRFLSPGTGLLAAAMFYTIPMVIQQSTVAKNYGAVAALAFLALYAACKATLDGGGWRWLVLAGGLAGFAAETHMYGILLLPALGLTVLLLSALQLRNLRGVVAHGFAFGTAAVIVAAPWYTRNWVVTGDPAWPWGWALFHGIGWNWHNHAKFMGYELGAGRDPLAFLMGPWNMTVNSALFHGDRVPAVSPLFLAFIPGLLLLLPQFDQRQRRALGAALFCALMFYLLWFSKYQYIGYALALTPALSLAAGAVAAQCLRMGGITRWSTVLALAVTLGFGGAAAVAYNAQFVSVVLGRENPERFVADRIYYYADIQVANRLPEGSKLLVFPLTDLYFQRDHINGLPGFTGQLDYTQLPTIQALLAKWQSLGITHVFKDSIYFNNGADHVEWALGGEDRLRQQMAELERDGFIQAVYVNQEARIVDSRTLQRTRTGEVTIYEVRYPQSLTPAPPGSGPQ